MSDDKLYCINGEWMPYSDAHNIYGYTLSKAVQLTLYRQDTTTVNIRKDTGNDTLWDSPNHRWVGSIANLNLYQKLGKITLYKCESPTIYDSYNQALSSTTATHVDVESLIVPITELYETEGITTHPCKNYYTKDGEILCWYDDVENLYWDNRDFHKNWSSNPVTDDSSSIIVVGQMNTIDRGERLDSIEMVYVQSNEVYTSLGLDSYNDRHLFEISDDVFVMNSFDTPIELPTVTLTGDFPESNWICFNSSVTNVSFDPGDIVNACEWATNNNIVYDTDKTYAVVKWNIASGTVAGRTELEVVNNNGLIAVENISDDTLSVRSCRVAVCSSNDVEVLTVYNLVNASYNMLKYTASNGSDYYYVLDEIQTFWSNEIQFGYSFIKYPPQVFEFLPKPPATSFGGYNTIVEAVDVTGNQIQYSDISPYVQGNNTLFCIGYNQYTYGFVDTDQLVNSCLTMSDENVAWCSSKYYQNSYCVLTAFTSDISNDVTLVNVYQTLAPYKGFKAFKFEDKYFVVDKVQNDWVSESSLDLIGYQVLPVANVVYTVGGPFFPGNKQAYNTETVHFRDANDSTVYFNDSKTYSCVEAYDYSGNNVTSGIVGVIRGSNGDICCTVTTVSQLNIYSMKYATQDKLPDVVHFRNYHFGSSVQEITLQANETSQWLRNSQDNLINQSNYRRTTPAVTAVYDSDNNVVDRTGVSAVFYNNGTGSYCMSIKNDTLGSISCKYADTSICYSSCIDVTVITVYDFADDTYNAFKYVDENDVVHYYVLDGVHNTWVEDILSIGYSTESALPVVRFMDASFDPAENVLPGDSFDTLASYSNDYSYIVLTDDGNNYSTDVWVVDSGDVHNTGGTLTSTENSSTYVLLNKMFGSMTIDS